MLLPRTRSHERLVIGAEGTDHEYWRLHTMSVILVPQLSRGSVTNTAMWKAATIVRAVPGVGVDPAPVSCAAFLRVAVYGVFNC